MADATKRRRLVRWAVIITLVALIVSFRLVDEIGQDVSPDYRFVIVRIIDGDTVELQGGDKLRLLSIDTPESGEPLYDEATRLLTRLTLGKTARIEYGRTRRDRYGRLLGYLYVDGLFVNKIILENGLGYLYLFRDTELNSPQIQELLQTQRAALDNRIGLWALPREAEDHYVARPGSFRFHRPICSTLSPDPSPPHRIFNSREEALYEGLSPCRRCKP